VESGILTKGLSVAGRLWRHIGDPARAMLLRLAAKDQARRVLLAPEVCWELVG